MPVLHSDVLDRAHAQNTGWVVMCPEFTVNFLVAGLWKGFGGTLTGVQLLSAAAAAGFPVICGDIKGESVGEVKRASE